ncbi:LodA/GoxA family CTQ-dependent oxidase [Gilvimarinus algae]|uniref:LodA/GoxA family CTQ-dependent oxidase n=1 Tax=Gilvimarinus algae TaxID=3058037 RepID=A0ABT8TIG7_9GAMM|nr:LodA/GoxA family CTQ-dependent oxidase [Gilvimarinus sp. SDUM040014]MDO3383835.1 LodA/GoxA family CTQ-dependent oxidase [Gilvimarinus sp. SDUM040014]
MANQITQIRIHPGIGIARLGNSDEYFIGPEALGVVVDPGGSNGPGPEGGSYRDSNMNLKRQAQRYRIYGYDANGNVIAELNSDSAEVSSISWRVHVRNMKAANYAFQGAYLFDPSKYRNPSIQGDAASPIDRDQLIIDPGPCTINATTHQPVVMAGDVFTGVSSGTLPGYLRYCNFTPADPSQPVEVSYTEAKNIELGQLRLDDKQRLVFVPAPGKADCVTTPKVELSNPSESHNPPNGPENGEDPLTNQFAYFNVPGWWDDTCGGEIDATITFKDGSVLSTRDGVIHSGDEGTRNALNGGWVVTAPPKYAPYMYHVVSILDRVYEAFPEADPNKGLPTNFYRDVYPILSRACNYGWVSAEAAGVDPSTQGMAHGPRQAGNLLSPQNMAVFTDPGSGGSAARKQIYNIMRTAEGGRLIDTLPPAPPPAAAPPPRPAGTGPTARGNKMPKLWGTGGKPLQNEQLGNNLPNQYLSLTDWQLQRMEDWANGDFDVGEPITPQPLDTLPLPQQPGAMDAAALEPTIGGGFHPGIEFPYLIAYPENFAAAFRVKAGTEPGSVAAYMSSPWQGDYWSCNTAWWPVQRPDIVFQYNKTSGERTYKEWFRGYGPQGKPLSSSDGYNQMVYAWPKLGMVLPEKDSATGGWLEDNGEMVFQEYERDPALDSPPDNTSCY